MENAKLKNQSSNQFYDNIKNNIINGRYEKKFIYADNIFDDLLLLILFISRAYGAIQFNKSRTAFWFYYKNYNHNKFLGGNK